MQREKLDINQIIVQDRQRELDSSHVSSLAESMKELGLVQPIVINQEKRLIAGGHRLAAGKSLGWTTIDVVYRETLSEDELQELELTENIKRSDLRWQDKVKAIAKIHALKRKKSALDSKPWGQRETGELLGVNQCTISYAIVLAKAIEAGDEEIINSDNPSNAWSVIMRRDSELAEKELAERHMAKVESTTVVDEESGDFSFDEFGEDVPNVRQESVPDGKRLFGYAPELPPEEKRVPCAVCDGTKLYHDGTKCHVCLGTGYGWKDHEHQICMGPVYIDYEDVIIDLSSHYIKGDSISFMNDVSNAERFDHIICDIPYGIDIENIDQHVGIKDIEVIKEEHTVEGNKELFKNFFPAAFHCLKPNAFLVTWCDQMLWQEMYDLAIEAGFKVQRWPFIWCKDYPCLNQTSQYNFTKSTEIAMVCRKGIITLPEKQSSNYIICGRDDLQDLHPFAKPFDCWQRLINAVSIENQSILDPFVGVGSSFLSGLRLGRNMYGIEINERHYNAGLENLKQFYTKLNPKTVFK